MNKVFILLIALTMVIGSARSQSDAAVKKILDRVHTKMKNAKGINATFTLVSKSRLGKINNNVSGKIFIKGNKYYIKEGGNEIFSDGNKTWNYNGNDEVTVSAADADDETLTPQKILTGFSDKDFSYKLVSSAGNYNQIQLVPTDKRKSFQKVNLFVDKSKNLITRATVLDKSNNTIEFKLNSINTNADIADNTFVFDQKKYKKNIEVIE